MDPFLEILNKSIEEEICPQTEETITEQAVAVLNNTTTISESTSQPESWENLDFTNFVDIFKDNTITESLNLNRY